LKGPVELEGDSNEGEMVPAGRMSQLCATMLAKGRRREDEGGNVLYTIGTSLAAIGTYITAVSLLRTVAQCRTLVNITVTYLPY
jgi:hypothetical protein